jgi:hypothetical protein
MVMDQTRAGASQRCCAHPETGPAISLIPKWTPKGHPGYTSYWEPYRSRDYPGKHGSFAQTGRRRGRPSANGCHCGARQCHLCAGRRGGDGSTPRRASPSVGAAAVLRGSRALRAGRVRRPQCPSDGWREHIPVDRATVMRAVHENAQLPIKRSRHLIDTRTEAAAINILHPFPMSRAQGRDSDERGDACRTHN